jgi:nitroreductase
MADYERLSLPIGEAIFTQRAIRRVKPDPIPEADLRLILEAAGRAPSATNRQPWHFLVVKDAAQKQKLQSLYEEAWWNRRRAAGITRPEDIPESDIPSYRLTQEMASAPVLVLACDQKGLISNEVLAAVQNLMLAARSLGIGATVTKLGGDVDGKAKEAFGIPDAWDIEYLMQIGYPAGRFGPAQRKPLSEITSLDRWGNPL